jgi:hypothetical protein
MSSNHRAAVAAIIVLSTTPVAFAADAGVKDSCAYMQTFTAGLITVTGAYVRATLKGAQSAGGYLTISNSGPSADTLTSVTSPTASDIAIHQMKMNGQVMEMGAVDSGLEIPAGGSVSFDPHGYHLMLTGITGFTEGQCIEMTLHFAGAGDLRADFNVGGPAQSEPPMGPSGGVSIMSSSVMDMSNMSMSH